MDWTNLGIKCVLALRVLNLIPAKGKFEIRTIPSRIRCTKPKLYLPVFYSFYSAKTAGFSHQKDRLFLANAFFRKYVPILALLPHLSRSILFAGHFVSVPFSSHFLARTKRGGFSLSLSISVSRFQNLGFFFAGSSRFSAKITFTKKIKIFQLVTDPLSFFFFFSFFHVPTTV